jgi:SOS-response transcriptional repressor LexA
MDIYALRRARLALLVEHQSRGNIAEFARTYGYSRSQISQFLSDSYNAGRSIGERAARSLEEKVGNEPGWLDLPLTNGEESMLKAPFSTSELRVATNQTRPIDTSPYAPYLARIPIVAMISTESEESFEDLPADVRFLEYYSLDALRAYQVKGSGLRPRVKSGEYLVINDGQTLLPGDDVVLSMKDKRIAVVRYLYEQDGEIAFGTLNERDTITFTKPEDIGSIEVIVAIAHQGTQTYSRET